MNVDNIKANVDRKIERQMRDQNLSLDDIALKLKATVVYFNKMLSSDVNSDTKRHLIASYNAISAKRIKDIEWVNETILGNKFFAGIKDAKLFKLIQLRDKVSQDALEAELY